VDDTTTVVPTEPPEQLALAPFAGQSRDYASQAKAGSTRRSYRIAWAEFTAAREQHASGGATTRKGSRPRMRRQQGWVGAVLALILISVQGQAAKSKRAPEYPLYCAGLVVGMSTGADARRMYGDGLFVADEGHGGGRYYVDPKHQVTMHIVIGPDDILEEVAYSRGIHLPGKNRRTGQVPPRAVSTRLTAHEHLYGGIELGEKVGSFIQEVGKPTRDRRRRAVRMLTYAGGEEEVPYTLFYTGEFRFVSGRLTSSSLSDSE